MRFVIQRVRHACVTAGQRTVGSIERGLLVLAGISDSDTEETADKMLRKMTGLRIFGDDNGKTNLDLKAVDGSVLLISQFTLYADCRRGNRPSFIRAGKPDHAGVLFDYLVRRCRELVPVVETGVFGADMQVELQNDGPFTILLDSDEMNWHTKASPEEQLQG